MINARRFLLTSWKRISSYFKTKWKLEDYPLEVRLQRTNPDHIALSKYTANIINWGTMFGLGETEEQALENLSEAFSKYAAKHELPRPGIQVPIKFASTDKISRFQEIATDFFPAILNLELSDCFISDESSLMDFGGDWSKYSARVLLRYKADISDLEPGNLVQVFERIKTTRGAA